MSAARKPLEYPRCRCSRVALTEAHWAELGEVLDSFGLHTRERCFNRAELPDEISKIVKIVAGTLEVA